MVPLNKKLLYWRYDTLLTISFPLIHTIIDGEKSIYWALLDTSWKYVRRDNVTATDESSVENCH